ncbi:hypothetical protein TD95_002969 [Thielaviopsis punctulata]|uniref:Peptidase M16 N-terminal domain-containing protein n=1 Tax=Thielaviopsis punctulata TaxID=72032 RepID=A0A0F4ZLC5_9PEZI|nr:hypothetical protein TD95_002969 [Thielaviopsis punctulata]
MGAETKTAPVASGSKAILVTDNVEKSDIDDRTYRVIRLENQLEVLIAHDPNTDKASAAIDVNVGAFSDEEDMPGMAHAVEHLLFMGTKKYPVENHYSQYLSANSGSSNAYTASTSTNYYFDVSAKPSNDQEPTEDNPSPFHNAMDIFAQFFIEPLFLPETLDRELKAVDSENKKNLQSDMWRLHQLQKSTSNPKHPYCHFSTGNFEVLKTIPESKGVNVRDKFIEFHAKHYSANLMKLVVLGREPIELLEKWVVEIFSAIPNKNLKPNRWTDEPPLRQSDLRTICYAKPVYDVRELCLSFPSMDESELYREQPSRYVTHLVGHEGPGSLMAYLKGKGWVNTLSVGNSPICAGSSELIDCEMKLTEAGLENYKEIVKAFFQYVSLLKETKPQQWIFDEQRLIGDVTFKYLQKTSQSRFTSKVSAEMQRPMPREWIISGMSKLRSFNPDLIEKVIDNLNPDNFRITLISKTVPGEWDQREKWYNTEYKLERIDESFLKELRAATNSTPDNRPAELHLPGKNRFIPTNLDVRMKEVKEPAIAPLLIRNDAKARTWWKKDDTFGVPKATVFVQARQPLVYATCHTLAQARLYGELVRDALEDHSYDAELAGLSYSIRVDARGFSLEVSGYNDKLEVLLQEVLLKVRDVVITDDRFNIVKEHMIRSLRNWKLQSAYNQVSFITQSLVEEKEYPVESLLKCLEVTHVDDVRHFHKLLLSQLHFEVLVHGNLDKEDALNMTLTVETTLSAMPLAPADWPIIRHLILPPNSNQVYNKTLEDAENVNNCIDYWYYIGTAENLKLRATLLLFDQILDEPAFNQLRTKEQLGYIVFSSSRVWQNMMAFRILIQSEKYPQYLHSRIEVFLEKQKKALRELSNEDFEMHKRSLIVRRLKKFDNLSSETSHFNAQLRNGFYRFGLAQEDAKHIKDLTKQDIIDFYERYISNESPYRAKLAVELFARGETAVEELVTKALESVPESAPEELKATVRASVVEAVLRGSADKLASHLVSTAGLSEETAQDIVGKIGASVKTVAASRKGDKKMQYTLPENVHGADAKFITDVALWKRGMKASAGALPYKDIHEFEELVPKL